MIITTFLSSLGALVLKKILGDKGIAIGRVFSLTWRNIKLFFKNKATVFLSLLAPILIFLVYTLFLGNALGLPLADSLGYDLAYYYDLTLRSVTAAWMMGGIISMACFTIGLNSTLLMVSDKEKNKTHDFLTSPMPPRYLFVSYFLAAFLITFLLTFIIAFLGFLFLYVFTTVSISFADILPMIGILALACLSSVALILCFISFFKSTSTSVAFVGIFSLIIGVLIGAFVPGGILPYQAQYATSLIPGSHASTLFRQIFLRRTLYQAVYDGMPNYTYMQIREFFSLDVNFFGRHLRSYIMYLVLAISAVIFGVLYFLINLFLRKRALRKDRTSSVVIAENKSQIIENVVDSIATEKENNDKNEQA